MDARRANPRLGPDADGRKRRVRAHVLADLSVNALERWVLACDWALDRVRSDYGFDAVMFTYSPKGHIEAGQVWFQVKATDRLRVTPDGRSAVIRVDARDARLWREEPLPVVLVLYDASSGSACWHDVQGLSVRRGVSSVTVRVPLANLVGPAAIRHFRDQKLERMARLVHTV